MRSRGEPVTDFDPAPYAEGIRELNRREAERIEARLARARDEAERLAKKIAEADDRVTRVILFGSVATGRPSREDFDIDLALDGGDPLHRPGHGFFAESQPGPFDPLSLQ